MNNACKVIWSHALQQMVVVSELVSSQGKGQSTTSLAPSQGEGHWAAAGRGRTWSVPVLLSAMALGFAGVLFPVAHAQSLASTALPTGGSVAAGQASISSSAGKMVIDQTSQRAAINWQSFNVGAGAHVHFNQPSSTASTLNRVTGPEASTILGRITAPGQVIISNGNGVFFGRGSMVDVGSLVATTHSISNERFMAGALSFERNGATGSVVNEGELRAKLEGYIALIAPEVRNQGLIVASKGTVALAAGELVELQFDANNKLTNIRVQPGQWQALVENKQAIEAEGGLVILSAMAARELYSGVVRNSGSVNANALQRQGGRIVLSASHQVENTGSLSANATADGPAGRIEISAPQVVNSGSLSATGWSASTAGQGAGSVLVQATHFTQTAAGSIDLSAPQQGGTLRIQTTGNVQLQGSVNVQATQDRTAEGAPALGGQIDMAAQGDIEVNNATLDASGGQGGTIALRAAAESQPDNPHPLPDVPGQGRLAIMGNSTLSTRGRSAKGGSSVLLGDHIELLDTTAMDATGATGGGHVLVGGDWQGGQNAERRVFTDPNALYQATTVTMAAGVSIDASATDNGKGGTIVLWSDIHHPDSVTRVYGSLAARGGAQGGDGGQIETSGFYLDALPSSISASATKGKSGEWLLDPYNIIIASSSPAGTVFSAAGGSYTYTPGLDSTILASSINAALNAGTNVTVTTGAATPGASVGDITVNSAISATGSGTLTLTAYRNIVLNANINTVGVTSLNAGGYISLATNLSTAATMNFNGPVRVTGGDRTVSSSNGDLNFNGKIDSFDAKVQGLTVTASNGAILFADSIGSIYPIFNLSIISNAIFKGSLITLGERDTIVSTTTYSTSVQWDQGRIQI